MNGVLRAAISESPTRSVATTFLFQSANAPGDITTRAQIASAISRVCVRLNAQLHAWPAAVRTMAGNSICDFD
jgi:hypothetical protein